jgi:membrane associated rhomboid family serine protease
MNLINWLTANAWRMLQRLHNPFMNGVVREARSRLGLPLVLVAVLWIVEVVNLVTQGALLDLGIRPRSPEGLRGIVFAPFLHASLAHLVANTVPFLVLGWLVAVRGLREFFLVTVCVMVLGGAGVWLVGRPFSVHVGASGLIFGYLGFLLARGFWERSVTAIALSLVALFLYGGVLWGVLPASQRISWEGHLFGLIAGIVAGRCLSARSMATSRVSAGRMLR